MFKMLKMVRTMMGYLEILGPISGFSLREGLEIVRKMADLGMPPSLDEEQALRLWVEQLAEILQEVAQQTPTELDDKAAEILADMVCHDLAWEIGYGLMRLAWPQSDAEEEILVGTTLYSDTEERMAADLAFQLSPSDENNVAAISPMLILTIISAIVKMIKLLRNE